MERRSLLDQPMTPTQESRNVFDDEFEVENFDIVADGFRPEASRQGSLRSVRRSEEVHDEPIRTVSAHYAEHPISPLSPRSPPAVSRNSMRKSRGAAQNPFASPEDDERTPSLSFEPDMAHRSISSASSHHFAGTSSPRFGAGPSHPYNMYPQNTIPLSASIATQSTVRAPPRRSMTQNGPQHPYTLYPQGVDEDLDDEESTPQQAVPVGFPGLGQPYHRRMGPDGEEQDIIGEDGHTEQLPPYTRYPEDGPEKMPLLAPAPPTALHSRAPVAGTDPTMSLMHTTIQPAATPEPQSMMDESTRSGRPASMSNVELLNSNASVPKSWSEKSWKQKSKTRVCGCIPIWIILLAIGVVIFIVAVIAGVIGGFVEGAKKHDNMFDKGSTTMYDASVIATPASSPPTGTYQLSLSTPQETQAACLTDSSQQAAWNCNLGGQTAQGISIGYPPGNDSVSGAFIFYGSEDDQICYGSQAPFMFTTWSPFIPVTDNDAPSDGPAFYFQQFYDKVVVVPEEALAPPSNSNKAKRQGNFLQLDQGWLHQRQVAQPGEKPWFCVWNNTFLEGFIYVQQPIASTYSLTSATPTATADGSVATTGASSGATITPAPTDLVTTTMVMASTTATFTGPAAKFSAWSSYASQHEAAASSAGYGTDDDDDDDDDDGNGHQKRQNLDYGFYEQLDLFPYVVKLEERRLTGNTVQPYCQQYQILDDGGYNWVADGNGNAIFIELDETDPSYGAYESAGVAGSRKQMLHGRAPQVPGGCHCQWMSGQVSA